MIEDDPFSRKERIFLGALFVVIAALISADLIADAREGSTVGHMALELAVAFGSGIGALVLLKTHLESRRELRRARENLGRSTAEARRWKEESEKFVKGLGEVMDSQFERWGLSASEKEVALLLLKGLSLKEVAEARETAEKTARIQAGAVYQKSGLAGRSELAAFFLEDLLLPTSKNDEGPLEKENLV